MTPTAIHLHRDEIEELRRDGAATLYRYRTPAYEAGHTYHGPLTMHVARVEHHGDWQTIVVRLGEQREGAMESFWGIVELLGYVRMAGRISEVERFGAKLGQIDTIGADGKMVTKWFGAQAVYCITQIDELSVRREWESWRSSPSPLARVPVAIAPPEEEPSTPEKETAKLQDLLKNQFGYDVVEVLNERGTAHVLATHEEAGVMGWEVYTQGDEVDRWRAHQRLFGCSVEVDGIVQRLSRLGWIITEEEEPILDVPEWKWTKKITATPTDEQHETRTWRYRGDSTARAKMFLVISGDINEYLLGERVTDIPF